jgi:hypothetical protein
MVWLGEAKYLGLGNDDKPNENIFLIQEISGDYRKVAILQYTDELWLQTTPWLCRKPWYWQRSPLGRSGAVALSESLLSEDHIRA